MIVTPFEVGDSRETVKARLVEIIEFYKGAGTADNLTTWGDARALLNDLVPNFPLIANGESGASVRAKLNEFHNDPELVALVNPEGTVFKTAEGKVLIRPASNEFYDPDFVALVSSEGDVFMTSEGEVLIRLASPE